LETTATAVIEAGCGIAQQLHAHALVAFSRRGRTAILCSQRRPVTPIIAFTPEPEVRNLLACVWGVQPHVIEAASTTEGIFEALDAALVRENLADRGHRLVVLMSSPTASLGPTNVMTVHHVGSTTGP
jgi:pyruvate kinase